jgi:AcrR family transcriptional regulator
MDRRDTRQRLLEASLRLISEKGYLGATTREIAREAGVTELTLFRHFGSKKALFEEVLKNLTFLPRLRDLMPGLKGLALEEALTEVGVAFIQALNERNGLVRILLSEVRYYPEQIRDVYERFIEEIIRIVADYLRQKDRRLRPFKAEMASRAFLGMHFSFFLSEVIIKGRDLKGSEINKRVKEFVSIFIKGVDGYA